MKVERFSSDGKIVFAFDQDMFIPEDLRNYTMITDEIEPELLRRSLGIRKVE